MTFVINGTTGATQSASFDSASTFGFKNRIINGAMMIDQRNAGASVTPANGAYTLDRWRTETSGGGVYTVQQSTTAPAGYKNSLLVTVTTADASIAAGDYYDFEQFIEGFNTADLAWGTASASPVTLSFWVRSSVTGTFAGSIMNSDTNRVYVFTYAISSANTWEQKTVTIAGDTSGTWLTTSGRGLGLFFDLGNGSTYQTASGSWGSAYAVGTSTSVKLISTVGATFYITGVQLEKGSTATSFDYRPYGTELALCQRYFQTGLTVLFSGATSGAYGSKYSIPFPVAMRAAPTITYSGTVVAGNVTSVGTDSVTTSGLVASFGTSTGAGQGYATATASIEL